MNKLPKIVVYTIIWTCASSAQSGCHASLQSTKSDNVLMIQNNGEIMLGSHYVAKSVFLRFRVKSHSKSHDLSYKNKSQLNKSRFIWDLCDNGNQALDSQNSLSKKFFLKLLHRVSAFHCSCLSICQF